MDLCGLALLVCGVLVQINLKGLSSDIQGSTSTSAIGVIVIGCIIFVIAFFGCCGAIREHHCMVVTYAIFLLSILIIQIALSVYLFVVINGMNENDIKRAYEKVFNEYWVDDGDQAVVNTVQAGLSCCGAAGPEDYMNMPHSTGNYPWSCCAIKDNKEIKTCAAEEVYRRGCDDLLVGSLKSGGKLLGGIVLGIAGVELIGIIFALCLANSIRNDERRTMRV
ncbi:hypothetical protein PV325_006011 [Microctonus aethiopoides]|nr:hypothetical protein PV325_006011 [Microctonus aethiopoides]